jgi:hypothetical protein
MMQMKNSTFERADPRRAGLVPKGLSLIACGWLAVGLMGLASAPAAAQGAGQSQGQRSGDVAPPVRVPPAILTGLLAGTPDGVQQLKNFLAADGASPDEITARAIRVVQQLKDSRGAGDPSLVIAAADRVAQTVSDSLNAARVVQLKVDSQFRVPEGAFAFDFGPADKPPTEGFERVQPNDERVRGAQMQGVRRPGDGAPILSGGITGVEGLQLNLPDGEYRVILMTEALGDASVSLAPFGQQIVANGNELNIFNTEPEDWLRQAVLSRRGIEGLEDSGGRQGGAITLTVRVSGGKLIMDFRMAGAEQLLKTYLTGLVIQPIEQPPLMARTQDADPGQRPADQQLRSEAQLAQEIATLLQEVEPAAGPRERPPLDPSPLDDRPITEPTSVASPS